MEELICEVSVSMSTAILAGLFSTVTPLVATLWLEAKVKISSLKMKVKRLEMELDQEKQWND